MKLSPKQQEIFIMKRFDPNKLVVNSNSFSISLGLSCSFLDYFTYYGGVLAKSKNKFSARQKQKIKNQLWKTFLEHYSLYSGKSIKIIKTEAMISLNYFLDHLSLNRPNPKKKLHLEDINDFGRAIRDQLRLLSASGPRITLDLHILPKYRSIEKSKRKKRNWRKLEPIRKSITQFNKLIKQIPKEKLSNFKAVKWKKLDFNNLENEIDKIEVISLLRING
jgi:hypothetical protein